MNHGSTLGFRGLGLGGAEGFRVQEVSGFMGFGVLLGLGF